MSTLPATGAGRPLRVALVTNIPAPYRVPVYNRVAQLQPFDLTVFYAAPSEPDRNWDLPALEHKHVFLDGTMYTRGGRFIHHSPALWGELVRYAPDVVVTTGYNPTHLLAFFYTLLYRKAHVVQTDGSVASEAGLSVAHRALRSAVIRLSRAAATAGHGGWRLMRSYGMAGTHIHFTPLCANTSVSWHDPGTGTRDIDLLFSGRLVPIKNAGFALQVAAGVAQRLGRRVTLALLGGGPLEPELRAQAATLADRVQVVFAGHVSQAELPGWFQRARLFVFPTLWDPWGVVANEACLAGVPVLASPHAGAAGELVRDDFSGRVLPLHLPLWVDSAASILADDALHARLAEGARLAVAPYSFDNAAAGFIDAALQAAGRTAPARSRFVRRPRVVCVQRRLPHYRVPLFQQLRDRLDRQGIEFVLVHGDPAPSELSKDDSGHLPWAVHAPCRYTFGERLVWQGLRPAVVGADLVIVTQENRLIYNLLALTLQRPPRLAYWGHGRNFQTANPHGLKEQFKRRTAGAVDWWYAYTEVSAALLRDAGYPPERITTLDNAVDTRQLAADCASVSAADVAGFRASLGLGPGPVGLFLGSLYADKRIGFLLDSAAELRRRVPGFQLLVVGSGLQAPLVQRAAASASWIHPLGVKLGRDKALCLRVADLMLNPGLVGLGILDSFVAGLPMVTTDCHLHSPEVAYLRHGYNGLITADSLPDFVSACEGLLRNPAERARLAAGALADGGRYTLEHMAERFAQGITSALQLPAR